MSAEVTPEEKELLLLKTEERQALVRWRQDSTQRPLSPVLAAQLQVLFFNGYECPLIAREKGLHLGAVVQARLTFRWDEARVRYLEELQASLHDQAVKAGRETLRTTLDLLACANAELSGKARKYLAGEPGAKPPVPVESVAQYKALVELVLKVVDPGKPGPPVDTHRAAEPERGEVVGELPPDRQLAQWASGRPRGRS